jgi:DNA repair photolyase
MFEKRLEAPEKFRVAGYRVRLRLDPILPFEGRREAYAETIKQIFEKVYPKADYRHFEI